MDKLTTALDVAAAAAFVRAGFLVHEVAGFAVLGAVLVLLSLALSRKG